MLSPSALDQTALDTRAAIPLRASGEEVFDERNRETLPDRIEVATNCGDSRTSRGRGTAIAASILCHGAVLLALSAMLLPLPQRPNYPMLVSEPSDRTQVDGSWHAEAETRMEFATERQQAPHHGEVRQIRDSADISLPDAVLLPEKEHGAIAMTESQPLDETHGAPRSMSIRGRDVKQRQTLLAIHGGNRRSEQAVERGLRWIESMQRRDGSWSFGLEGSKSIRNPGTATSTTAATALALLPFFAAGHTHEQGEYQRTLTRGIYYLASRMIETRHGGDFQEGTMYGQGLATLALAEAYAMTSDENLRPYAQAAVNFVVRSQHSGGGWRYMPGEPGDITVTGWQLMALQTAKMAGLEVPQQVTYRAMRFLDSIQSDGGAKYGYRALKPAATPTATAVGLLSRMYGGWWRTTSALDRGAEYLASLGPSPRDIYFNYYATQVMHQTGGARWEAWNEGMRDHLVATQASQGNENGSWHFNHRHGNVGGRLYTTAMALLTLEVYYRHSPLYEQDGL